MFNRKTVARAVITLFMLSALSIISAQSVECAQKKLTSKQDGSQKPLTQSQIITAISDSAILKMAYLDLTYELLGVSWLTRENVGIGKATVQASIDGIRSKYKIPAKYEGVFDDSITKVGGRFRGQGGPHTIYLKLLDTAWSEIVHFDKSGHLPIVKCRGGQITLDIVSKAVSFTDDTECMVEGKEYRSIQGNWSEK